MKVYVTYLFELKVKEHVCAQVTGDWTTVFRTEDTPANISHATSRSDLSNLCGLSDDSDHDNILAECIQSGMPQVHDRLGAGDEVD